jgi:hypothetical protein
MKNNLTEEEKDRWFIGKTVNVKRLTGDVFSHDFTGSIVGHRENLISVSDQDGDVWDVEVNQLSENSDEYVHGE